MVLSEITVRRCLLTLCGPTTVGKTDVAIALGRRIGGEVVAADSRTVYRYMDIGTAKPTPDQRARVPHHLLDVTDPDHIFTVANYRELATAAIEQIFARQRLPLLVGGTGLYVRAICDGFVIPPVAPDWHLRADLEEDERRAPGALHRRLATIDQVAATRIHPRNVRRLVRALEVYEKTGRPITEAQQEVSPPFVPLRIGLSMNRAELYKRIERRVDQQLAAGLVDEVRALLARGYSRSLPSMQGVGYKEIIEHLDGAVTLDQARQKLQRNTRRLAKRQFTWFRSDPRIHWIDVTARTGNAIVDQIVAMIE